MSKKRKASNTPRLSIGLPVYNGENYLREGINSILQQDFDDFELIISDNGSFDETENISREFALKDSRVKYFRHEKNKGAAFNFNFCVEKARGKFFKWHAHDDACLQGYLSACMKVFDEVDNDVVLVQCSTILIDEFGEQISPYGGERRNLDFSSPAKRVYRFVQDVALCTYVFGIIRLSTLKKTRQIDSFVASDIVLLLELTLSGKFLILPDALQLRRAHETSSQYKNKSSKELQKWFDPSRKVLLHPRLRYGYESFLSIFRAQISIHQKALSFVSFLISAIKRRIKRSTKPTKLAREVGVSEAARQMAEAKKKSS